MSWLISLMKRSRTRGGGAFDPRVSILLVGISLSVLSCGLEDSPYIIPPEAGSYQDEAYFSFRHPLGNDQDTFEAYWVLYRIYQTRDAANNAIGAITGNQAMETDAGYNIISSQYKYRPILKDQSMEGSGIFNFNDLEEDVFNSSFQLQINVSELPSGGEAYLFSEGKRPDYDLFRNAEESETFQPIEITPGDPDLQELRPEEVADMDYYYINAWVFGSAINVSTFLRQYSSGVNLGVIQIRK